MNSSWLLALLAAWSIAGAGDLMSPDGLYLTWLDPTVPPGRDFFSFANGNWIKTHPIPADRSYWGVDSILEQDNQSFIRSLVESPADGSISATGTARKVVDFYASGMDERGIDAAGISPLLPELNRISSIATASDLRAEFAHLQLIGVPAPFLIGQMPDFMQSTRVIALVTQAGLGLPNRDYYLKSEPSFAAARAAYVLHVARVFMLLGDTPEASRAQSETVMGLETRLAKASMSDIEQRDPHAVYHPMAVPKAAAAAPHLDWRGVFAGIGHPETDDVNVATPAFFKALDREMQRTPLAEWKSYLRWQLAMSFAPYLSQDFVDEDFRLTSVLTGAEELQPRWLRVLRAEDDALGFAIGELYVKQKFPAAAKQAATLMVGRVRDAMKKDLANLAWMTPATRAAAVRKLELMELRIGYPDHWRDYSALAIDRGPFVLNVLRAREFEQRRQYAKFGQTVDRSEWFMTPQTVNAYYDPSMNSLNVPAGILQPPYFDVSWPDAVNYGATGATTAGHEMTHGFDDQGAKFDGQGNLKEWWAPKDLEKFRAASRCIADQYSAYVVAGGLHVQGDLVAGEAAADLGGVILAYRALEELPPAAPIANAGTLADAAPPPDAASPRDAAQAQVEYRYTREQQFFLAFAHAWAGSMRPAQAQELVTTDPHPPAVYRTNATLGNVPEFQAAFGIATPSPMIKAERCVIW